MTWNGDFARGLLGLLGNARAIGEAFQITSDEVLTWDQIFLEAFDLLAIQPNILHVPSDLIAAYWPHASGSLIGDKMHHAVFDNSKIKDFVPDYMCDVNWRTGLGRALAWHEAHAQFQTIDHEIDKIMDDISAGYYRALPGPR